MSDDPYRWIGARSTHGQAIASDPLLPTVGDTSQPTPRCSGRLASGERCHDVEGHAHHEPPHPYVPPPRSDYEIARELFGPAAALRMFR